MFTTLRQDNLASSQGHSAFVGAAGRHHMPRGPGGVPPTGPSPRARRPPPQLGPCLEPAPAPQPRPGSPWKTVSQTGTHRGHSLLGVQVPGGSPAFRPRTRCSGPEGRLGSAGSAPLPRRRGTAGAESPGRGCCCGRAGPPTPVSEPGSPAMRGAATPNPRGRDAAPPAVPGAAPPPGPSGRGRGVASGALRAPEGARPANRAGGAVRKPA